MIAGRPNSFAIKAARRQNYQQRNRKKRNSKPLKPRGSRVYGTKTALRQDNTATEHHGISWRPKNTCDPFVGSNWCALKIARCYQMLVSFEALSSVFDAEEIFYTVFAPFLPHTHCQGWENLGFMASWGWASLHARGSALPYPTPDS